MKKLFIVSSLLGLFFASASLYAEDASNFASQDDQSLSGANLSSNNAQNPFGSSALDNASAQPQLDAPSQTADDSDSW
jgi:hypothetical protein